MKTILSLLTLLSIYSQATLAQEITGAWMRRPNPVVPMTAAFMEIHNKEEKDIYLTKVTGDDADNYEIHTHKKVDGVMKMRQIPKLRIPAKGKAILKPMSDHVMILQIKKGHLKGDTAVLNLHFDNGKIVKVETPLKKK